MSILRYTRSAATVSWIDPATGLPEVDNIRPIDPTTTRAFLTGDSGYRFCNFIDIWADYDTVGRSIIGHGFTAASKLYRAPSFAHIPSHVFPVRQNIEVGREPITFTQIVGARTESPEVIGGAVGGVVGGAAGGPIGGEVGHRIGRRAARAIKGFPPIWSELRLQLFNDGRTEIDLLRHSYFPSLTFYKVRLGASGTQTSDYDRANVTSGAQFYDAIQNLEHWKRNGWDPLCGGGAPGPTDGNPWGFAKDS